MKINKLTEDKINNIIEKICTEYPTDIADKKEIIDFNKIIPEPKTVQECELKYLKTKDTSAEELSDKPWFNWYDWRLDNWDTKWNAYNGYIIRGKSYVKLVFQTAWSAPIAIYNKLFEMFPDYNFEIRYADEAYGSNCAKATRFKGEVTRNIPLENAEQFAKNLWDKYDK